MRCREGIHSSAPSARLARYWVSGSRLSCHASLSCERVGAREASERRTQIVLARRLSAAYTGKLADRRSEGGAQSPAKISRTPRPSRSSLNGRRTKREWRNSSAVCRGAGLGAFGVLSGLQPGESGPRSMECPAPLRQPPRASVKRIRDGPCLEALEGPTRRGQFSYDVNEKPARYVLGRVRNASPREVSAGSHFQMRGRGNATRLQPNSLDAVARAAKAGCMAHEPQLITRSASGYEASRTETTRAGRPGPGWDGR